MEKPLKYYSSNVREPLEKIPLLSFLRTCYNSMSWVAQACSKIGEIWIWSPVDGNLSGICLGATLFIARDIQVQSFNHLASSYLK